MCKCAFLKNFPLNNSGNPWTKKLSSILEHCVTSHEGTGSETTTEYVSIDGENLLGPELPMTFDSHCATKINDSLVILTGGFGNHGETLLVTIPKNEMISGPKLLHERYYHGSGVFINEGVEVVVVAGGYNGHEFLTSTEIWIPSSGSGWIEGDLVNPN